MIYTNRQRYKKNIRSVRVVLVIILAFYGFLIYSFNKYVERGTKLHEKTSFTDQETKILWSELGLDYIDLDISKAYYNIYSHRLFVVSEGFDNIDAEIEYLKQFNEDVHIGDMVKNENKTDDDKRNNIPLVYTDADKLQQIMVNLIENAAKYSDEGKKVIVKTEIKEQFLSIKVIDEGIGIAKEDLEKIFKKFSRLDTPLTRKTQGSGIGLYITKTLIEKLHGMINVDSSANGSTFEVKIPLVDPEQQIQDKLKENENAG